MNSPSSSQRISLEPAAGDGSNRAGSTLPGDAACDQDQPTVISQRPPASGPARSLAHYDLAKQLAGERLNHFQLLEYVGGGGMGAVFRALDTMLNRDVALKVLSRDQGADDETRRRFQNEAQSAARLDHENIARVYYVGEDRGLNYIVFEFIEGVNLREVVERKGPLALPEALSYTLQVAHALAHAASRDVVHRDIKPSNMIITDDGRAKLVDMGLARLHQVQPDGEDLTASGVTLGTFDYISPEQARDPRGADVRSDIYSLGCTLYYMLTGRPPFPDGTVLQKLLQHNSDAPPDPREFDPSLPLGVSALVSKMLAKDPLRRYQLPSELIADVLLLAEQIGCRLPGTERSGWLASADVPAASAAVARHLPWLVPVSLLLVSTVVAGWPLPGLDPPDDSAPPDRRPPQSRERLAAVVDVATGEPRAADRDAGVPQDNLVPPGTIMSADPTSPARDGETVDQDASAALSARSSSTAGETPRIERSAKATPAPAVEGVEGEGVRNGGAKARAPQAADSGGPPSNVVAKVSAAATEKRPTEPFAIGADALISAEPIPEGLLVVGDGMKGPRRYGALAEACAAAKNGDVIELRYDGPRAEPPLVLNNLRIEIRAGALRRPLVVFRPSDTNPIATDRSMIGISGGSLKLSSVDVELDLSEAAPSENWSLFTIEQADSVRLEHCQLTVRNATAGGGAYHDKVAFFSLGGGAASEPMIMMPKGAPPLPPVQIALNNCLARGEADLLVDRDLKPVTFSCVNGLVAVSERLFVAGEGASMPQEGVRVRIELDHVTALARQGLCRIAASEAAPAMPEVEMRLSDSLILSDMTDAALVEHVSEAAADKLQAVFHWEAVNTDYRGFRMFWRIGGAGLAREFDVKTYADWTKLWPAEQDRTTAGPLAWRLPGRRALNTLTPADFQAAAETLPADGDRPAGVDFNLLPQSPGPSEAEIP